MVQISFIHQSILFVYISFFNRFLFLLNDAENTMHQTVLNIIFTIQ